ncbi:acetyl-CoA carboxylase carboxyltransferase subunit beta [bacterium]|nr:acetyl-CoA carboxylase carboxyltransferase subunit beta [bacterium]
MSIIDWFAKKEKNISSAERLNIPGDVWVKCTSCSEILFQKDLDSHCKVCSKCGFHFRISPAERIRYIFDHESFVEYDSNVGPVDFLGFFDTESYSDRIRKAQQKFDRNDAIVSGVGSIGSVPVNASIMDFFYMGGSMGSVVGEKITRTIERSIDDLKPVVVFTSSGGARMQEGIMSLMQMAKTSAALERLAEKRVPYISVLCDPTTGGTSASFAILGDVNIAEPGALISFAGPRVIEQTIRQKLPKGFQRAEFLLKHGMVDMVVDRRQLRETLQTLLQALNPHGVLAK